MSVRKTESTIRLAMKSTLRYDSPSVRKPTSNGVMKAVHSSANKVTTSQYLRNFDCGEMVVRPIRSIWRLTLSCARLNASLSVSVVPAGAWMWPDLLRDIRFFTVFCDRSALDAFVTVHLEGRRGRAARARWEQALLPRARSEKRARAHQQRAAW